MSNQMLTSMVLHSWYSTVKRGEKLFESLSDEELMQEVAPKRNRAIYLLGHLASVHDMMLPLLGLGEAQFPELLNDFIRTPDDPNNQQYAIAELREKWNKSNANLAKAFENLSPEQWLEKHTSVSDEDFAKQPHRNRLNVLISRTNHLSYHLGQLALLNK
ncbi:MAG: DinB family protein [Bacteroidota bacterium]